MVGGSLPRKCASAFRRMVSPNIPEGSVPPPGTKGKGRGKGGPKKGRKSSRTQEEEEPEVQHQEDEQK